MNTIHQNRALISTKWCQLKLVAISVLIALAVLFLYHCNPAISNALPPCPFHAITGLYCPGCGSLRSVHQLLHGNLPAAFGLNPLAIAVLPFLGYSFISYGAYVARKRPPRTASAPAFWIWLLLASIIAFWILRNIPVYPFTLLAP